MKITATIDEARQMTGIGRNKLFELIARGELGSVKVGGRRLVKVDSLRALLEVA